MELGEQISLKTFIILYTLESADYKFVRYSDFLNENKKHEDSTSFIFFFCGFLPVVRPRPPLIENSRSFPAGHTTLCRIPLDE